MAHAGGRPPMFRTVEELQSKIDEYFETEDGKSTPTVSGLAAYLDTTRKTLLDYENKEEFRYTIKKAKTKVEAFIEKRLYGNNVTGLIFNLKNNFDWKDKTEVEQKTEHTGAVAVVANSEAADKYLQFLKNQ